MLYVDGLNAIVDAFIVVIYRRDNALRDLCNEPGKDRPRS
jgi:hypothetical protein